MNNSQWQIGGLWSLTPIPGPATRGNATQQRGR
jgi:hypothetical protein